MFNLRDFKIMPVENPVRADPALIHKLIFINRATTGGCPYICRATTEMIPCSSAPSFVFRDRHAEFIQ